MMEVQVPQLAAGLRGWRDHLEECLSHAITPLAAERALERAVLALRHIWLEAAASSTAKFYRSPAGAEKTTTPSGRFHNFGYERDLQPCALEARCAQFFRPPPQGWGADHVLFSSGQAAMNALLTLLSARQARRLRFRHEGCYFETSELLSLYKSRFAIANNRCSDLIIAEPIWCDGKVFGAASFKAIAARANADATASIIVDSTLVGLDDGLNELLCALHDTRQVFRVHSGLKLFQGGLELADVGIVSVYGSALANELRKIRTLQGSGLRFAEVAALELPLFLDPRITRSYEDAVFANNEALAHTARGNPALVVSHPADGLHSPFVILELASNSAYELDEEIAAEAARRSLNFTKGGSFGFRGHRFETVRPDGRPPFLRVAMGRRRGPSFDGILELFRTFTP